MTAIGGTLKTLSIDKREFRGTGDANVAIQLGGFNNETLPNGDASARMKKTVMPWSASSASIEVDLDNNDLEFLEDVKNSQRYVDIVIELVGGSVFAGIGNIEGELSYASETTSATLELKGPGRLKLL